MSLHSDNPQDSLSRRSLCSPHGSLPTTRSPHGISDAAPPGLPPASAITASIAIERSSVQDGVDQRPDPVIGTRHPGTPPSQRRLRRAPSATETQLYAQAATQRAALWDAIRLRRIRSALGAVGLVLPPASPLVEEGVHHLNKPLQSVLSEFVRRTRIGLPEFAELLRGQTADDYRPIKNMIPAVLRQACRDYEYLPHLLDIAQSGARVPLAGPLARQSVRPPNHRSADERYNVLVKNIRREQDAWRCIVVDEDILELWLEIHISPFGVVDKGNGDPQTTGRVIHDLSCPVNRSLNDHTDRTAICQPKYQHCDAVATAIVQEKKRHPGSEVKEQAGDVSSAYRHVCIHSQCVHLFGGRLHRDAALIIDMSAAFGWSGSPGNYDVVGGAISFVHGNTANKFNPDGFFSYHWVDDHINVAADVGSNCMDMEQSLRHAMLTVLGPAAINEDKFSGWCAKQKTLGLVFDSVAGVVAMPADKVAKAQRIVRAALGCTSMSRTAYRSLLGSLRHVATCIRPTRAFLQRLRQHERYMLRWQSVPVNDEMRADLYWWLRILATTSLNGVPLEYFNTLPEASIIVEMDASDSGLCAIIRAEKRSLTYKFNEFERKLIEETKDVPAVGFDINYREILSCAFAVYAWGASWAARGRTANTGIPLHIHYRIDNTSAVSWQSKLASGNRRAQTVIRLLSLWEVEHNLRFSSSHIPGVDNTVADAGSRMSNNSSSANIFASLTSGWSQIQATISSSDLETISRSISEHTPSQ